MKKIFKALKFSSIFLLVMALFIACDKDFSIIDSDVLGKGNANFDTDKANLKILAYNKKLDSLQINGLSSNLFGVFNDPAFGQTKASIIAQVTPTSFNPDFGDNPVIDSVVLNIPYYSKQDGVDEGTNNIKYSIKDSLYGGSLVRLTLHRSNYFLRDFNPNSEFNEAQTYYSKADGLINNTDNFAITQEGIINFDDHIITTIKDTSFIPIPDAIVTTTITGTDTVNNRAVPAFRTLLDNTFWKTVILDKEDDPVLSNANNFRDYFRGLYFKADAVNGNGNMILLNFATANITIHYSKDSTVEGERVQSTYILNFTGNRLNTFINDFTIPLANGNKTLGDEKLYLKGAEGSMAIINLFDDEDLDNNGVSDELESFKKAFRQLDNNGDYLPQVNGNFPLKKLINEAHLVIYEDENVANGGNPDYHKYDRIYAYDIKNNSTTIDYLFDPSEDTSFPLNSKIISLGQRQVVKDDNGIEVAKYKIRITEHLNNILLKDSTNTKLGLTLSTNVNLTNSFKILDSEDEVTEIPATALLAPRGTILYGTNVAAPNEDKKMKLEIFITEPNL